MIAQFYEKIISTRYLPDLAYRNGNTSIVLIADNTSKNQFIFDTVTYYAEKDYPVILLGNETQAFCAFSTFSDNDKKRIEALEHITYCDNEFEKLFICINRGYRKFNLHPIIILMNDLPEQETSETKELFNFIEKIKPMNIQIYMFSPKYYDYLRNNIKNIGMLEYYWDHNEEYNIKKINFINVLENKDLNYI